MKQKNKSRSELEFKITQEEALALSAAIFEWRDTNKKSFLYDTDDAMANGLLAKIDDRIQAFLETYRK